MKALKISAIAILILLGACSKKEVKLEAFNAEAYAYDLGNSWEVDGTTRVKGLKQNEKDNKYTAKISYTIDLVKPDGSTLKSVVSKTEDKVNDEKVSDVPVEIQFDLDSTYQDGNYKIIFNIKDAETEQSASASASFKLEK